MNKFKILTIIFIILIIGNFKIVNARDEYLFYEKNNYNVGFDYRLKFFLESISKEENHNKLLCLNSSKIETNYKIMTTSIYSNYGYYRYEVTLVWKNMPKIRSYDIIGIGFYQSVKVKSNLNFKQEYCLENGSCIVSRIGHPKIFPNGAGITFKLPEGKLTSLKQTLYFDVEKNTNNKILFQEAFGDYAHSKSVIDYNDAKKYRVFQYSGIILDNRISNCYDSIIVSEVSWNNVWK